MRGRGRFGIGAALVALAMVAASPAAAPATQQRVATEAAGAATAARSAGTFELYSQRDAAAPVTWPACRAIEYRVNPKDMPAGVLSVVRRSMGILEEQTGVDFRYAGTTTRTFKSAKQASAPTIYLSFSKKRSAYGQTLGWPGEIGVGGPAAAWSQSSTGKVVEGMTYGRVLLYSGFQAKRTGGGVSWQSLILHEVGHALNLAHRANPGTVMHPSLTASTPAEFSKAEVRALKRVLQTSGCDYAAWSRL